MRIDGPAGCRAVLTALDGTLVATVDLRLAPADVACDAEPPVDLLARSARILLDAGAPWRERGLPRDDAAGRERVVEKILAGELEPGERDMVDLPDDVADLSDTGEVIALRDGADWTIVFFEHRGVVDRYAGWVYRSSGRLGRHADPLGGRFRFGDPPRPELVPRCDPLAAQRVYGRTLRHLRR